MTQYDESSIGEQDSGVAGFKNMELEEAGVHSALGIKSDITIKPQDIKVENIVVPPIKKYGRIDSLRGLTGVVGEWGIVSPIHVLKLEDDDSYMVLDGLRRLFSAIRVGQTTVPTLVWDFSDKEEGKEKANIISLMINRSQRFTNKELWEQMQLLEEINEANPGLVEFLLQMSAGDAMKLKDIMLSDVEYEEIRSDLMDDTLTIEGAYKKLCNERRKENRLAKEDEMVLEEGTLNVDEVSDEQRLSVDEVDDLLELSSIDVEDDSLEGLDRTDEAQERVYRQDPKNRHPLDPELRKEVLERDKFSCQCCGLGGEQRLSVLAVHHILEVVQGGPDTLENLVTVCVSCHLLIHNYGWGKIRVDFESLNDSEKKIFKIIFKYGNVIIEADKRLGKKKDGDEKSGKGQMRHPFPGEGLKDNKLAFKSASQESKENE